MGIRRFDCPSCGTSLQIKEDQKTLPCPQCGGTVIVPESFSSDDLPGDTQEATLIQPAVNIDPGKKKKSSSGIMLSLALLAITVVAAIYFYHNKFSNLIEVFEDLFSTNSEEPVSAISEEPVIPVVLEFGGPGTAAGYFQDAMYICLDDQGNIFIGERKTGRIQIFDAGGNNTSQWVFGRPDYPLLTSMAISRDGLMYMIYRLEHEPKIYIHNAYTGELVDSLEHPEGCIFQSVDVCDDGSVVAIVDLPRDDIFKFAPDGSIDFILEEAISYLTDDTVCFPNIMVDSMGNIFVSSAIFRGYFKLNPEGRLLNRFGHDGEPPLFLSPIGECIDSHGRLWAIAHGDLVVFDNDGTYLTTVDLGMNMMIAWDPAMGDGYQLYCVTWDETIVQLDLSEVVENL